MSNILEGLGCWFLVILFLVMLQAIGQYDEHQQSLLTPYQRELKRWGCEPTMYEYERSPRAIYECEKLLKKGRSYE